MSHSPSGRTQFTSLLLTTTKNRKKLIAALGLLVLAVVVFRVSVISVRSHSSPAGPIAGPTVAAEKVLAKELAGDVAIFNNLFPTLAVREAESQGLYTLLHHRWAAAPLAPVVTATKTDALFTDVDGDNNADPGDTLKYTVTINASGEDATGVTFTDTVDPNTAFVAGSLTATPVAVNDSYQALGNVRIQVPAASGVLANDFLGLPAATITAPPVTSTNGGDVALNADGSFTYNPPAGFEGNDTFTYTLTNSEGSNNATVTIAVNGMIWFINNNASCPCDGRLTNPFNSLSSFNAVNIGGGNNPAANDNIFLYESAIDYVGPVTLLSGQRFIGQDASASLSAITGLTPPTFSDPLPATNSGNGVIVNITSATTGITVASNNTLRGFTGGNSTTDILGTGFGTLTVSDVTLNGTGQAVNLSTGTLAATFISISSSGGPNGIVLSDTGGSFTVTGTGGTCTFATPTCSGGRITTTVGADNSTAGIGVSLNNVTNISLTAMRIDNHPNFAIRGHGVTGFTLQSSVVDGNNGTSHTADTDIVNGEDSIRIINLLGSALIDDCFIGGGYENNIRVVNDMGTLNRITISDSSVGDLDGAGAGRGVDNTNGDDNIILEARNSGTVLNATLTNNLLNNARGDVIQTSGTVGTSMDVVFRLNAVSNNHPNIAVGGGGATFTSIGAVTYDISCNSFRDSKGIGVNVFKGRPANGQTGGTWSGTIFNNTIGVTGVALSGSGAGASGLNVEAQGNGTHTTLVKNNVVRNYGEAGIKMSVVDANTSAPVAVTLNATVIGNTTAEPDPNNAFAGFFGTQGAVPGADANTTFNLKLGGAGAEQNDFTAGDPFDANDVFILNGSGDGDFNLTQGNSTSTVATQVVMDNNASPLTVFADDANIDVVVANPALPAAINETCTPPLMASSVPSKRGSEAYAALRSQAKISDTLRATLGRESVAKPKQSASTQYQQVAQLNDRQHSRTRSLKHHATRLPRAMANASLADVMLSIGTLPAGESVTITFRATVDDPFSGGAQVCNQGTVSGTNFSSVLTDDPSVGGSADATCTPIDLPSVSVAVAPASVAEDGATNLVYTFTRNGSTANALTVNFSIGGTATFGASPNDYTQTGAATFSPPNGTVTFSAGSATAIVTVDPEADMTVEADETVDFTVTSGSGYVVGAPSSASGTITNDDTDVSVAVSPASVTEDGASNLVYTFTRVGVTNTALTVNFSIGGTATFGASPNDYTQTGAATFTPPTGTVTFTAGSSTAQVTIDPEADTTVEPDETVILTVTSGTGYNVGTPSQATGTITNDDADVSIAVSPASVTEDGATNLVFTFTRTGFTGGALVVNFTIGGTATFGASPNDYTETGATTFTPPTGTVTFGAGNSTATITVDPEADMTPEPDETVTLTLAAGTGYNVVNPSSATGTILNDDTVVTVAVAPASTPEGGANLVYTFTRTGNTASAITVNFSVGGTATFGSDYSQSGAATFSPPTATVSIGAGNSSATVNVTPLADCVSGEGSETVEFKVQPGTGYGVGSPSTATGTIVDVPDTTAPVITLDPNRPMSMWPPNHEYHNFTVSQFVLSASDACDPNVDASDVYITKIESDEAEDGAGDGNTLNDITIAGDCKSFQLRAERGVAGNGRVYTIYFKVVDNQGNFTTVTAQVSVPITQNGTAVGNGPLYTVNGCP